MGNSWTASFVRRSDSFGALHTAARLAKPGLPVKINRMFVFNNLQNSCGDWIALTHVMCYSTHPMGRYAYGQDISPKATGQSCNRKTVWGLKSGKIKRGPCAVCGRTDKIECHHPDHDKPLEVVWLCVLHHRQHHHAFKLLKMAAIRQQRIMLIQQYLPSVWI